MTIENDIDLLVSDVTTRKAAVVKAKGDLDAIVAEGASAAGQAESAALAALSARDEASAMAIASGALATASVGATAYADLAAVAASKVEDAVDVFIYDTSLDSDGGAWRHRTQGTSWYREALNSATRGSRREFPAVAVIVAESNKVTIYDGDDPSLPMWKTWSASTSYTPFLGFGDDGSLTSVFAENGLVAITSSSGASNGGVNGVFTLNFPADVGRKINSGDNRLWPHGIAVTASPTTNVWLSVPSTRPLLVSSFCNDVAMTVLPDAPIDPATGLPVPTIAVATAGGVSVIKDDGTVVDLSGSAPGCGAIAFDKDGLLIGDAFATRVFAGPIPEADDTLTNWREAQFARTDLGGTDVFITPQATHRFDKIIPQAFAASNGERLVHLLRHSASPEKSAIAFTASGYVAGWMPGDIKGAWLADTDEGDLVEDELVTNGSFDLDASGWLAPNGATLAIEGGRLKITSNSGGWEYVRQTFSVVAGRSYRVSVTGEAGNVSPFLYLGSSAGAYDYAYQVLPNGVAKEFHIVAKTNLLSIRLNPYATTSGDFAFFDDVSVIPAGADRSVNNKGLIVNGWVRRAPVADGAELVAYSGFSAENNLEQPYNADLDFGTGDFAVMGWAKVNANGNQTLFERYDGETPASRFGLYASGALLQAHIGGWRGSSFSFPSGQWAYVAAVRSAGVFKMFANGLQVYSGNHPDDLTNAGSVARIGLDVPSAWPLSSGSLALWRATATAPSADQIARIYNDERALFEPGAACTLYGDSDAVTALAHDKVTNLLHAGTSAGRSVFDGLRRVAHTTSPVGNAIAAHNGLIIED